MWGIDKGFPSLTNQTESSQCTLISISFVYILTDDRRVNRETFSYHLLNSSTWCYRNCKQTHVVLQWKKTRWKTRTHCTNLQFDEKFFDESGRGDWKMNKFLDGVNFQFNFFFYVSKTLWKNRCNRDIPSPSSESSIGIFTSPTLSPFEYNFPNEIEFYNRKTSEQTTFGVNFFFIDSRSELILLLLLLPLGDILSVPSNISHLKWCNKINIILWNSPNFRSLIPPHRHPVDWTSLVMIFLIFLASNVYFFNFWYLVSNLIMEVCARLLSSLIIHALSFNSGGIASLYRASIMLNDSWNGKTFMNSKWVWWWERREKANAVLA